MKDKRLVRTVIILVVLVGAYLLLRQSGMWSSTKDYYAFYDDVQGLEQGAPVYINGVKVGKVDDIDLNMKQRIKVTLSIDKDTKLPVGTVAMIVSGGLIGNRSINLIPSQDANITAEESVLASAVDPQARSVSAQITPMVETGKILLYSADSTMRAMNVLSGMGLLRTVSLGIISFDSQMTSYKRLSASLNGRSDEISNAINNMADMTGNPAQKNANTNASIANARRQTADIAKRSIADDLNNIRTSIATVKDAVKKVDDKKNPVGKMLNDKTFYENTSTAIDSLNSTMQKLKDDPPGFSILGK